MAKAICFTGFSASGKTTLAKQLAKKLEFPFFSIGNTEFEISRTLGYNSIQERYDVEGIDTYAKLIPYFIESIKEKCLDGIVIESIYDEELLGEIIKEFRPENVTLIRIGCRRRNRLLRYVNRQNVSREQAKKELYRRDAEKRFLGLNSVLEHATLSYRNDNGNPNFSLFLETLQYSHITSSYKSIVCSPDSEVMFTL
ncbi:hypothetical protein VIBNISFn27_p10093 [Vibrio nigripulchritudo SFn27]|uniref:Uncharacterized protein n=1 Tax=Vibrio nigripulchritudo TaxID=28173 RepID=A0A9P1JLF5_9VIBR|nr:AAA family ATPase [Vibrio nigripulchritudo]CBJ93123.1 Protein of unknown function [Vibrio nigripulchritudo]CCN85938.1 hypothetical protein VIBNIBLFn1_p0084 [Vibrio nigripulchritudo BLFn1]CCN91935.1 hypothetical protein VIBNISFn27_p10093 [Vibrio nigripulchritudo SFn27]CCN97735.1 hypothetical protein VIBNIENn2_p0083 [Vibrio nigripulchritudo ENn2]CCO43969.1 hypothetical protein VIBNISFn135_p10093 [Vibrio nigripulchritudo SFn135]